MAKKEFKHEVIEHITDLKEYNKDYTKSVMRMIWNDNPITMDIRMVNRQSNFIGKGISLSDEECDKLVDVLLDNGYGTIEKIKEVVVKNMKRTNTDIKSIKDCEDIVESVYEEDGYIVVDIPKYN